MNQGYIIEDGELLFDLAENYDQPDYCQSVLNASKIVNSKHYELSDVNVIKLLHDHGADYSEWKEDCKRVNDPLEILLWLGY
tara:strand:- start:172 stop:417 length:246 start_codon:yes stop_codon:yes gene_type:complete